MSDFERVRREYLDLARRAPLRLAIVGKDPFPTAPTGIPFCKETWQEQTSASCSGGVLLQSLGVKIGKADDRRASPKLEFISLLESGVVVLNASYEHVGRPIRKCDIDVIRRGFEVNRALLDKDIDILLCGEAKKCRWLDEFDQARAIDVVHPDIRNRHSRHESVSRSWRCWWRPDAIKSWLNDST